MADPEVDPVADPEVDPVADPVADPVVDPVEDPVGVRAVLVFVGGAVLSVGSSSLEALAFLLLKRAILLLD